MQYHVVILFALGICGCVGTMKKNTPPLKNQQWSMVVYEKVETTNIIYAPTLSIDLRTRQALNEMRAALSSVVVNGKKEMVIQHAYVEFEKEPLVGAVMIAPDIHVSMEKDKISKQWRVIGAAHCDP